MFNIVINGNVNKVSKINCYFSKWHDNSNEEVGYIKTSKGFKTLYEYKTNVDFEFDCIKVGDTYFEGEDIEISFNGIDCIIVVNKEKNDSVQSLDVKNNKKGSVCMVKTLSYIGIDEEEITKGEEYLFGQICRGTGNVGRMLSNGKIHIDKGVEIVFEIVQQEDELLDTIVKVTDLIFEEHKNINEGFKTLEEMVKRANDYSIIQLLNLYGKLCVLENTAFQENESDIAYKTQTLKEQVEEKILKVKRA